VHVLGRAGQDKGSHQQKGLDHFRKYNSFSESLTGKTYFPWLKFAHVQPAGISFFFAIFRLYSALLRANRGG